VRRTGGATRHSGGHLEALLKVVRAPLQRALGRVAAIAVIRTFLNDFLERDAERQQRACAPEARQGP